MKDLLDDLGIPSVIWNENDIIQISGGLYLYQNLKLRKFPDEDTRYYLGFYGTDTIQSTKPHHNCFGSDIPSLKNRSNYELIELENLQDDGKVYLAMEGKKYHIPEPNTFGDLVGEFPNTSLIKYLNQVEFDQYITMPPLKKKKDKPF